MGKELSQLPHNEFYEKVIIGTILIDPAYFEILTAICNPEDFYTPKTRWTFQCMSEAVRNGDDISPGTIIEASKRLGLEHNIDFTSLTSASVGLPRGLSKSEFKSYVLKIKKKSLSRILIRTCNEIASRTMAEDLDENDNLSRAESEIFSIADQINSLDGMNMAKGFESLREVKPDFETHLRDMNLGRKTGTPTGIVPLDNMLDGGGLQRGGVYYVGASPKAGKTSLMLKLARNIGFSNTNKVALVTTAEMEKMSMIKRIYSPYAGIPYSHFRPGLYGQSFDTSLQRLDDFTRGRIKISVSIYNIQDLIRHVRAEKAALARINQEIGVLIVDYLQIFSLTRESMLKHRSSSDRAAEVATVSRELKLMAMIFNIPIIAVSSLTKDSAKDNREPELADMMLAGQIGYDAEAVMFLHNPEYVPGQNYVRPDVELINLLLKAQRNGPTGTIPLWFVGKYMEFLTEQEKLALERMEDEGPTIQEDEFDKLWEDF